MKNQSFIKLLLVITAFTASVFFAQNLWAQDTAVGTGKPNVVPAASASQTVPKLSYGVPQILELAHAKIGDKTIIAYIRNSGVVYRLGASQIVYLKQQGVSEAVIAAMINQRPRESSATVAQPATTYAQTVPSSTAYVVPYTQTYYYYSPYYYPYYGYYGWPFPAISFSFGFGGGHWGGYHGRYRYGGGHRGGGFHGGGFHGGRGHHR